MKVRAMGVAVVALTMASVLSGCGSKRTTVVQWWTAPSRVGAEQLARACSDVADGYRIEVHLLPDSLQARRSELIRRMSVGDDSIDVLTLDSAVAAEFGSAGYLAALPADLRNTAGLLPAAVSGASYDGKLVAVPWWVDPQLLWYRGAAAERASIDTAKPVSWNRLLSGADRVRASVQLDDPDGTGLSDWVRGLVGEAGGAVVSRPGRKAESSLNGLPGRTAAGIVQYYAASGLGPGPSDNASAEFAGSRGAFLIARASVRSSPTLSPVAADMKPLPYPVIDGSSAGPVASAGLAVAKASPHAKAAFGAVRCLTSAQSQEKVMVNSGAGAARESVYRGSAVTDVIPFAQVLLTAARAGVNVPASPYWHKAERAITDTWTPLSSVAPRTTPAKSDRAVTSAVAGGLT